MASPDNRLMKPIARLYEKYAYRDRLSREGVLVGHVFDEDRQYEAFFDSVFASFETFDAINRQQGEKTFFEDFVFILECTNTSLSSTDSIERFSTRIDSYLYIYRRIEEYLTIIKNKFSWIWTRSLESNVKKLKETILELLTKVFIKEKGSQPNLRIKDKVHLRRINVIQYLQSISKIDSQTINRFLLFSKLSFQSSRFTDEHLQWKDIITFQMDIKDFISTYIDYELAFREFPLDVSGLIELIRLNPPPESSPEFPFTIFMQLYKQSKLSQEDFFKQYQIIFETCLKEQWYTFPQMGEFLSNIARHDRIFNNYFSIYADTIDLNNLWKIFIHLYINTELNGKYLVSKLAHRTINASINDFLRYAKFSREAITQMKETSRSQFLTIFENIFDVFIEKQLNEDQLTDSELKELLKMSLEMLPTQNLQQPSCLLIIRRLLFQEEIQQLRIAEKIKDLFTKLNDFDRHLCENNDPMSIIQDQWLQNHLLAIPEDLTYRINRDDYQYLCHHHRNNRWTIYIWRKLIQLSILKSTKIENTNHTLFKINDWMNLVKHNIYDLNDTLTNIFVICLFETIIIKNIKSVLSLPNIPLIIDFILHLRQDQLYTLDIRLVDQFIQNGKEAIRQILTLQGKSEISKHISIIHFRKLFKIS